MRNVFNLMYIFWFSIIPFLNHLAAYLDAVIKTSIHSIKNDSIHAGLTLNFNPWSSTYDTYIIFFTYITGGVPNYLQAAIHFTSKFRCGELGKIVFDKCS